MKRFLALAMSLMVGCTTLAAPVTAYAEEKTTKTEGLSEEKESPEIGEAATVQSDSLNPDIFVDMEAAEDPDAELEVPEELECNAVEHGFEADGVEAPEESGNRIEIQESEEVKTKTAESSASDFQYKTRSDGTLEITGYTGSSGAVNIPAKIGGKQVTRIGSKAFYNTYCDTVVIPEGVKEIGEAAFMYCWFLTDVSLPKSLRKIEAGAFVNDTDLEQITLNSGLQSIGDYAFQKTKIESIKIPSSVTSIGDMPFYGCTGFKSYSVDSKNTKYMAEDGVLFSKSGKSLVSYPIGKDDNSYTIPETVTVIKSSAFQDAKNLRSIKLGSNVKKLEDWVFTESGLKTFTLPSTITSVGDGPLDSCEDLTSIVVSNTPLKELPYRFAYGCTSLKSVKLSGKLVNTGALVFAGCSNLTSVTLNKGLKEIKNGAFGECASLTKIVLPSGLKTIAYQAFFNDEKLTSINIPSSVTAIYKQAFYNCPVWNKIKASLKLANVAEDAYIEAETLNVKGTADYTSAYKVLELVNQNRKKQKLSPLTMDKELLATAMQRAAETSVYFAHERPYGGSCFDASSKMNGENIAMGYSSADWVMDGWMNSPGHRANILGAGYQSIGIGCFYQNGYRYWVQCFGTEKAEKVSKPKNASKKFSVYATPDYVKVRTDISSIKQPVNKSQRITVYAENMKVEPDSFKWKSSNTNVATVSSTGLVKTKAGGSTTITITNKTMSSVVLKVKVTVSAKKYSVTFQPNGGTVSTKTKGVYRNNVYGTLPKPTRKGYTFIGWYTAKSGGSKVTSTTKVSKSANHTLYAHWKCNTYAIKYVMNGGKNHSKNPTGYNINTATIKLQKPTKTGYTFAGWYSDSTYKTKVTQIKKGSTGTKTLYAKWTVNKYSIRYHANGGDGVMEDTVNCAYSSQLTLSANEFEKSGYQFVGWNTKADGSGKAYSDEEAVKGLSAKNGAVVTLYAQWEVVETEETETIEKQENSLKDDKQQTIENVQKPEDETEQEEISEQDKVQQEEEKEIQESDEGADVAEEIQSFQNEEL